MGPLTVKIYIVFRWPNAGKGTRTFKMPTRAVSKCQFVKCTGVRV